jgi:hypothetical protein
VATQHPDIVAKMERIMREQHVPSKFWPIAALDGAYAESPASATKTAGK